MNRLRDGDAVTAVGLATRPLMRAAGAAAVAAPPPRDDEDAERAGARDEECIACSCIFLSRRIEKGGGARKAASFSFRSNWERGGKKWQESSSSSPSRRLTVRNRKKIVMAAFVFKLFTLSLKTISKPLASRFQTYALGHPTLRAHAISIAQVRKNGGRKRGT